MDWFKDGKKVVQSKRDKRIKLDWDLKTDLSFLEIKEAKVEDSGNYTAVITNDKGTQKADVAVVVKTIAAEVTATEQMRSSESVTLSSEVSSQAKIVKTVSEFTDDAQLERVKKVEEQKKAVTEESSEEEYESSEGEEESSEVEVQIKSQAQVVKSEVKEVAKQEGKSATSAAEVATTAAVQVTEIVEAKQVQQVVATAATTEEVQVKAPSKTLPVLELEMSSSEEESSEEEDSTEEVILKKKPAVN